MRYSGIGGQAVLEGVMMRNGDKYAVAVRKPDKSIASEVNEYHGISKKYKVFKLPLLRGVVNFAESIYIGMKALNFSSSFYDEEEKEKTAGKKDNLLSVITVAVSIILAVGVFMLLPYGLSLLFAKYMDSPILLTVIEGVIRLVVLVGYIVGISFVSDIHRVYMYHGAEHKVINCVESGLPLTVSNVRRMTRKHLRCGTSFILDVVFLSVIFFMFVRVEHVALRLLLRVLLVPAIAAVAYEFIMLAGKSENPLIKVLSAPGLWFQGLTTREPDDGMIEVAIVSVEAVFDWKTFLKESVSNKDKEQDKEKNKKESGTESEKAKEDGTDKIMETSVKNESKKNDKKNGIKDNSFEKEAEKVEEKLAEGEKQEKVNKDNLAEKASEENNVENRKRIKNGKADKHTGKTIEGMVAVEAEEENDEILNALDRFFNESKTDEKKKSTVSKNDL